MSLKVKNKDSETDGDKISVNFHISTETLEQIEDFLYFAKKRLPIGKRRKLTKSNLYEIGLKLAIEDYNKKGEYSSLWQAIQDLTS